MKRYVAGAILGVSLALSGCAPGTSNAPVLVSDIGQQQVSKLATFTAPTGCRALQNRRMQESQTVSIRSGCSVAQGDVLVLYGLSEITVPFAEAIRLEAGMTEDFRTLAQVFPREILSEYLEKRERFALSAQDPGWAFSNTRMSVLPGNGGVSGAEACVRFSFDGVSTRPPRRTSQVAGLRCARLDPEGETIEEAMLEVIAIVPDGTAALANFDALAARATASLRFR